MPLRRRLMLAAGALALLDACRRRERWPPLPAAAVVVALGDSITYGTGTTPQTSYPSVLAALTGWRVVNAGVPGDTSAQALVRLPALLAEHGPAMVIVSIGGNDFLRRLPERDTRANIERIVVMVRNSGAIALLVGVPRPTIAGALTGSLDDHPLFEELATNLRVPLAAGLWGKVLADERLRSDAIHANAAGYRAFARDLQLRLHELGIAP
jgi:acyl-CoA hydrolase